MSKPSRKDPSVVMLTADRQIDRRILLEADSLEADGWTVKIIAMPLETGLTDDDERIIRLNMELPIHAGGLFQKAYLLVRRMLSGNGFFARLLKRFAWGYLIDLEHFFVKQFSDLAFQYSPQIFVAHDLPMLPVTRLAAQRCGAKLVYDSHELYSEQDLSKREKLQWAKIEKRHIGACDVIITVNQSIANELEHRYGVNGVQVIYNSERSSFPPPQTRKFHQIFALPTEAKILLFQGSLSLGRNIEILVDAMQYVRNTSIALVILGDGPLLRSLKSKASSKKLLRRVHFHPAVSQKELLNLTSSADAGVIPYQATCLNNYFCTPNKMFEFIAAGLPIVASDLPEIRNLVLGKNIGLVGNMQTSRDLAFLLDEFFSSEQRLTSWQINVLAARKLVCWEVEEKKLVEIFRELR